MRPDDRVEHRRDKIADPNSGEIQKVEADDQSDQASTQYRSSIYISAYQLIPLRMGFSLSVLLSNARAEYPIWTGLSMIYALQLIG